MNTRVLLLGTLSLLWVTPATAQGGQPHIVIVVADDLGYHDVGYHGADILTPILDSLAMEGIRLENYYAGPQCSSARSQIMTGRYPIHTGMQHGEIHCVLPKGLPLEFPTLADKLAQQGYATHGVGKWHLGFFKTEYTPTQRGFDSFLGTWAGESGYYNYSWACMKSTDPDWGVGLYDGNTLVEDQYGVYSTDLYSQRAVDVINNHPSSQPLFLYLAYQTVKAPLEVDQRYLDLYQGVFPDPDRTIAAGMITAMDDGIGQVVDALKASGMWEDTVFVFTSDAGASADEGGSNFPFRGYKYTMWEGALRGLGFVTSPHVPHDKQGTVSEDLMQITDWYPTFLTMAGAPLETDLDGFDMWPTLGHGAANPRQEALLNIDPLHDRRGIPLYNDTFDTSVMAGIRVGDWKLLTGDPGPINVSVPDARQDDIWKGYPEMDERDVIQNVWLFNVADDPGETMDLSASEPDMVRQLLDRLAAYNATAVAPWYPAKDMAACPKNHGGAWVSWMD